MYLTSKYLFMITKNLSLIVLITLFLNCVNAQTTVNFGCTGGSQNWVVPPCVTSLNVTVEGAQGGGPLGGNGAVLTATITVIPGQVIAINVGCSGNNLGGPSSGGYGGGGIGFVSNDGNASYNSSGGGGASTITIGGVPYMIAAGGGGSGGGSGIVAGGAGGCATGTAGTSTYGAGGAGGTQTAGGIGGTPWAGTPPGGSNGGLGFGGMGGFWGTASGGGGGGGYYGGGGGGNDGCCTGANGGGGGGGGSSLIPAGGGCSVGANSGPGVVSITYTPGVPVLASNTGPYCAGATIQLNTPSLGTYSWSGPVAFASTLQNPTIPNSTTAMSGVYTVIVTSPSGCVSSATTTVTVNPSITPTFTPVAAICSGGALTALPTTSINGITGAWSPALNNTATTTYTFTPTAGLCATTTTMTITIYPIPAAPTVLNDTICPSNSTTLTATAPGGTYEWFDAPVAGTLLTTGASYTTPVLVANTTYYVQTTINGCVSPRTAVTVTISPLLVVDAGLNDSICFGGSYTLGVSPNGAGYSYVWDEPTNMGFSSIYNPTVNPTSTTTYTVTVTDPSNCVGSDNITITVKPTPTVSVPASASYCNGVAVPASAFTSTPAGGAFSWTNSNTSIGLAASGSGNTPVFNATNLTGATISGTVTVTPTVNGCVGSPSSYTITVYPSASTNAIGNIQACPGDIVPVSAFASTPAGGSFSWTNSNTSIGLAASGVGNTPTFTASNSSGSPVVATVSVSATANGCTGAPTTYTITVNPVVTSSSNVSICQGDSMLINGVYYATAGAYKDTVISSFGCDSVVTYNLSINMVSVANSNVIVCQGDSVLLNGNYYSAAGSYPFTFTSSFGCDSVIIYSVSIAPLPSFNISGGASINIGESSNLAVLPGVFGTTYLWDPPVGLSCFFCQNPIATPMVSTWYYVTVTSAAGCQTMDSVYIEVDPSTNIYVPNIFSPNNDDNNDMYLVRGKGVDQFNLAIYNRWGQLVFESNDIEQGWDGTKDGTPLNQGVFVYKLQVIMYNNDRIEQTGNITLIR